MSKTYSKEDMSAEFDRGYNFGKEDGVNEIITKIVKAGGRYREKFETDEAIIAIPKEYFKQLRQKASETA